MTAEIESGQSTEATDHQFHQIIAAATRNNAMIYCIEQLWQFRFQMPMWNKLHDVIRQMTDEPNWSNDHNTIEDHKRIVNALRTREAAAAQAAMTEHLSHVRETLLKASELDAIDFSNGQLTSGRTVAR